MEGVIQITFKHFHEQIYLVLRGEKTTSHTKTLARDDKAREVRD